jgi:hypothetical protein
LFSGSHSTASVFSPFEITFLVDQPGAFLRAVFSWTPAPMGALLAPLAQVPRKTREKEAGGGGVTTQADRV